MQRAIDAVRVQVGHPTGVWGSAAGLLMAQCLRIAGGPPGPSPSSTCVATIALEIGFGPGLAIEALSRIAAAGCVCGIDHAALMLRWARRRTADGLRRGVVDLRLGAVDAQPAFDAPFDTILAVGMARLRAGR